MLRVSTAREFWTALIYGSVGPASSWFGSSYPMGTVGRKVPGTVLGGPATALAGFGSVAIVCGSAVESPIITTLSGQPLLFTLKLRPLFALWLAGGLDFAIVALGIFKLACNHPPSTMSRGA